MLLIKALCDRKIQEFLEKRGLATWNYRLLESQPVPDTIRYDVLRRAGGKCELCGCSAKERPLHVDHILPRSKGGKNDMTNLQALCERCNLAKGIRRQNCSSNPSFPKASFLKTVSVIATFAFASSFIVTKLMVLPEEENLMALLMRF
jgi:hypothetical protein